MNDRPWMTALEMQFATLHNQRTARYRIQVHDGKGWNPAIVDVQAEDMLPASVPFAWSADTSMAVWLASHSIPEDAMFPVDMLPEGVCTAWWWFDTPLPIPMEPGEPPLEDCDTQTLSGLLLHHERKTQVLVVTTVRMTDYGPLLIESLMLPSSKTIGELIREPYVALGDSYSRSTFALLRFLVAAYVWLRQRILVFGIGHIERHRRKQLGREHNILPPSDIKVIQLRRVESKSRTHTGAEAVDWSCRWIVNGHWRNQPYRNKRELIYIMPYVKGPEDQPLKIPQNTVYQVSR